MRIKYENPPINELIMGLFFKDPIAKLRSEHVGLYWNDIYNEFPNSSQKPLIGDVDLPSPDDVVPMPRFWFTSDDEVYLIQIQRNAFIFNWRRRNEVYPHYEMLKKKCFDLFHGYELFCQKLFGIENMEIERSELSYINIIYDESYYSSSSDTNHIVPSFSPLSFNVVGQKSMRFNVQYQYPVDDDMILNIVLQTRSHRETNKDALFFRLQSSGELSQPTKAAAESWFDRAHDVIGDAFNSLTNPVVQRQHWQPREE